MGFAFVDLDCPEAARRAMTYLDKQWILDRKVSVQIAHHSENERGSMHHLSPDELSLAIDKLIDESKGGSKGEGKSVGSGSSGARLDTEHEKRTDADLHTKSKCTFFYHILL